VPPRALALTASGAVVTACVAAWAVRDDWTRHVGVHLGLYGLAFTAYLVALVAARGLSGHGLALALGTAVVWRVVLALTSPLLSDDVHRYVWEGRVQLHGGNPYAWSDRPDAPRWEALRDEVWAGVNHPEYTAVYPPLFLLACRAVVGLHDSISAMKLFLVACELFAWWPLAAALLRRGLPRERLLVWAWSPLALVEVAGSGHNEAFALVFVALSLAALESGRPLASALAAALGFQAKYLPGLVAAAWLRRYRWWHVASAAALAAVFVVPYLGARDTLLLSLSKYSEFWRFNETLFAPLAAVTGGHVAAVRTSIALVLALVLLLAWRRTEPVAAATAVVAATILLGPNVLPWYALWLLPLLVVRDEPGALLFTGTVGLAYMVYPAWLAGERWELSWGWRALEYGPVALVAAWSRLGAAKRHRPAA
jgi:alpha-1,6-mannosyltransferase